MKPYLTMAELFKALSEGKKVRKSYWPDGSFVHIVDGKVTDNKGGTPIAANFLYADCWEIFEEPKKPTKPTKLYAYLYKYADSSYSIHYFENYSLFLENAVRFPKFDTEVTLEN